jgi:hypothetical protein
MMDCELNYSNGVNANIKIILQFWYKCLKYLIMINVLC